MKKKRKVVTKKRKVTTKKRKPIKRKHVIKRKRVIKRKLAPVKVTKKRRKRKAKALKTPSQIYHDVANRLQAYVFRHDQIARIIEHYGIRFDLTGSGYFTIYYGNREYVAIALHPHVKASHVVRMTVKAIKHLYKELSR